jgi:hypothetical protein
MTAVDLIPTTFTRGLGAATGSATRVSGATVVCDACGCRLTTRDSADDAGLETRTWFHFTGAPGRDARGCAVSCVDAAHAVA